MDDDQIGHYFLVELGEDIENEEWKKHIDILVAFWGTVFLDEELYFSDPYGPHFTIVGLEEADFIRWMKLFSETADEIYVPEVAKKFKDKGIFYSKDFMQRLNEDSDTSGLKSAISWE